MITPGNIAIATEDKPLELTCSSVGGSPDPTITWFREGSSVPLQSYILKGGSKNHYTNATLQILPRRADDGAKYKCVVWNRAISEGHKLETTVTLNVNSVRLSAKRRLVLKSTLCLKTFPVREFRLNTSHNTIQTISHGINDALGKSP
ncbi:unnamed protein product [Ceratitis capitata]|uniref:(Mediterranean fruit fly) hypothetical protein n=1 Tax=Ceratitis capitata TaxID=7213 RepID=A0A811UK39_CERCA|nr:unnamed protein product [Ceratitis capitata]